MNFTLIGTGNMAWFLGCRLTDYGYNCKGVWGRDPVASEELAKLLRTQRFNAAHELPDADVCILAVSDQAVTEIAETLRLPPDTTVIHTAGALGLDKLKQQHAGVLWCVYSINKNNTPDHRNIPIAYEGSTETARNQTAKLAYSISDIVYEATTEQRKWLHLCAVIGNNFSNHLLSVCEDICRKQDLPFSLLRPIILQTFGNIAAIQPALAQTGPAKRGDHDTIENHKEMLSPYPHWQKLYAVISASIEDMYPPKDK